MTPTNGSDPTFRVEHTTGNQVTFTVKNTGTEDTRYDRTCTGSGSVVVVDCSFITGILIPGETRTVTATFVTGAAGAGTVQLSVSSTQPAGASAAGTWNETVVSAPRVTPDGDSPLVTSSNTPSSSSFTVTNTGSATTSYGLVAVCSGTGVTNCAPIPTGVTLAPSDSQPVTVNFTTQSGGTTGIVELQAQLVDAAFNNFASGNKITAAGGTAVANLDPAGASDNTYTVHYYVQVTATEPPSGQPLSRSTLVVAIESNDGSGWVERTISAYSAVADLGSGGVTNTFSHVQKAITVSGLGLNDDIRLLAKSFTHTGGGSGSFTVRGGDGAGSNPEAYNGVTYTSSSGLPLGDRGWVNVTVLPAAPGPGPVVDVASVNPGEVLARGQCLAIGLASAAASECGDLRIVHPLPSVRTMNRWRTPTLVYTSAYAIGWATVGANVRLPGSAVPSTVSAVLKIGGVTRASGSWAGGQWTPASTRRIALGFSAPAQGLTTGVHDYVLEVTRVYADSAPMTSVSGKLAIVDRSASFFGAGWWLAGLEEWNATTGLWIGGDGSARQYTLRPGSVSPNRVWGAPSVTYPDSIREVGSEFVRQLPDSVWVFFNAQGKHVRTRNRQGHLTTFVYDGAGMLSTVVLPPSSSPLTYSFSDDGTGRVGTIVAPGVPSSRTTTLTIDPSTGRLTSILEPDGRTVRFDYSVDHKIASRTDRRGTVTGFLYDAGGRVSHATINMAPVPLTSAMLSQSGLTAFSPAHVGNGVVGDQAWHTDASAAGAWMQVDLGVGGQRRFRFGRIFATTPYAGLWDFEYSDDGATWTKAFVGLRPDGKGWHSAAWPDVGPHRYWRILLTNTPGPGAWLSELELWDAPITRTLQQVASQGFAGTSVSLSEAFTRLDGPRQENRTSFYLNRLGAPDSIIDALGQRIRVLRTDGRFLGSATHVISVTGHTVAATYDDRGRILTSSAPSISAPTTATTTYQWDPKWDAVTRITNPEEDFTDFAVDGLTGNRMWQQDGRGSTTRTNFTYHPDNQLATFTPPGSGAHTYDYDAKGNLESTTSALGMETTWTNNNIGLTTQTLTPTGTSAQPGWAPHQMETIAYSIRNEDTLRMTSLSGESTTLRKQYDEERNLSEVTRTFSPNPENIDTLVTSWDYDRANRPWRQTEPDGTFERRFFDAAGNVDSVLTRRGFKITMTYDALNRLQTRLLPQVSYSLPNSEIIPGGSLVPYSYTWPSDNQSFEYYSDGQVSLATNKDATVTRTYHPSGGLLSEVLGIKSTDRATTHSYTTSYTYDRNGRRSTMAVPSQFAGDWVRYEYAPFWGALTRVMDLARNTFGFSYNERSELTRIDYGAGVYQHFGYDDDGRLDSDVISNPEGQGQPFPRYSAPELRNFAVTSRNARGQILTSIESALTDYVTATYSGLGYLATSDMTQELVNGMTQQPASYAASDTMTYDGLGNILSSVDRDFVDLGSGWNLTRNVRARRYTSLGRLDTLSQEQTHPFYSCCDRASYLYDAAGNNYFERTRQGTSVPRERAVYYGPDERLVASDTRAAGRRAFEEYRYDALGRRVWVRSGTTCEPTNAIECITDYVRRVIWDGAHELAEIQVPQGAWEELDTGYPLQSYNPAAGTYGDPNPFFGRVVYGPGLAVDQPLSVTRYEYRDDPNGDHTLTWPRFTWQVYWNYQGLPAYGTLTTGAYTYPYSVGPGQTECPLLGDETEQRCVIVQWPLMHSAYDQNRGKVLYRSWHGSLLESKRDRSGLDYRRNRSYDPQTGRFTQEDPIGLAGGLNLYGFAGGDPVNFSDPFGLCEDPANPKCKGLLDRVVQGFRNVVGSIVDKIAGDAPASLDVASGREPGTTRGSVVDAVTNPPDLGAASYTATAHVGVLSFSTDGTVSLNAGYALGVTADATYALPRDGSGGPTLNVGNLLAGHGVLAGGGVGVNRDGLQTVTVSAGIGTAESIRGVPRLLQFGSGSWNPFAR